MMKTRRLGWFGLGVWTLLAGACAPGTELAPGVETEGVGAQATVIFDADGAPRVEGTVAPGGTLRVRYNPARLASCRGEQGGVAQWAITGYWRVNGGEAQSLAVAGLQSSPSPSITLPRVTGTVELWFQNTNRWGCVGWDSAWGNNYRFDLRPTGAMPGWIGEGAWTIQRATCDGGPCPEHRRGFEMPFAYDTGSRQRAAIAGLYFETWKAGVTDRDNPDLWRDLDARVYYRFGRTGAFQWRHVDLDRRVGNNARYVVRLRELDPLGGNTVTRREDCPAAPLTLSADGQYVSTEVEYFFQVNGLDLRPTDGTVWRGSFANYRGMFAPCVSAP